MSTPTLPPALHVIPIGLIDPPEIAMRETMSDLGLEALADSMRRHGQLQNIGVVVSGDRYRVVYGHRRRVAAEKAGLPSMLCRVFPEGTTDVEAMKVDENEEQEAVNAAAQATYYYELLNARCDGDVDRLVALVRRKESFVLDRLDLIRGDADVLDALRRDRITLAVAKELNKVSELMYRRLWLHDAQVQGMNARNIRTLRQQRDRDRHITDATQSGTAPVIAASTEATVVNLDACLLCGSVQDQHEMTYRKVHSSCEKMLYRDRADKDPRS